MQPSKNGLNIISSQEVPISKTGRLGQAFAAVYWLALFTPLFDPMCLAPERVNT